MGEKIGARTKQLESLLRVGAAVVFQADPSHEMSPRFSTFIRGWEAGKYVILDRIQAGTERVMPVREGQQCAVRFVRDGEACAFCSSVVDWNSWRDAGWIRVRWPEEMETVPFRKHHRVNVSLPCKLFQNGTEIGDGEVVDVSIGGCGILTSVDLHFGSQVAVTLFLPNGVQIQNAEFSVRNVRQRSHVQRFLGCEFRAGQEQAQNEIAAFVVAELRPGNGGRGKAACGAGTIGRGGASGTSMSVALARPQATSSSSGGSLPTACQAARGRGSPSARPRADSPACAPPP
jgi:c-di-GMP-binding flagellar brake protein YcgR